MANEEIITALKNSVERGESLGNAMTILINSGYNPAEVREASNFVGGGAIKNFELKPQEHLIMPNNKKFFSGDYSALQKSVQNAQPAQYSQIQFPKQTFKEESSQIKQEISKGLESDYTSDYSQTPEQSVSLTEQLNKIKSKNESYTLEIILVIILLILIGVLIATIVFKPQLLDFFSKF